MSPSNTLCKPHWRTVSDRHSRSRTNSHLQQNPRCRPMRCHLVNLIVCQKIFKDKNTMNSALNDRFLSLIHPTFCEAYSTIRLSWPKEVLREVFQWVLTKSKYGLSTEFNQYIRNFSMAHSGMQSTINNLMKFNVQLKCNPICHVTATQCSHANVATV